MNNKISFALKITNWCNLNCAHCCERSGQDVAPNLMSIDTVRKYLSQFRDLDVPKFEHMVFTGGEAMAPYFHKNYDYIPKCIDATFENAFVPFIKTNGIWGARSGLRTFILNDLANAAHKNQKLVSIDMSVDEFRNNTIHVANIIEDVVKNPYYAPAIRISLVGLNTRASKSKFVELVGQLCARGLRYEVLDRMTMAINGVPVFYDFNTPVARMGRAVDNQVGHSVIDGMPDENGHCCFQIDNADTAILNYKWHTPVSGRGVNVVLPELVAQMTQAR